MIHSGLIHINTEMTNEPKTENILTEQEEQFCQLLVYGGKEYAGQCDKCYKEVFGEEFRKNIGQCSRRLFAKPHITARIRELSQVLQSETENIAIKLQVTETLRAIMEEAANANFSDRFEMPLSPAPLRAVSVNAAKALMELYPIKHTQESKLRIEGADGNVIFNVIVPQTAQVNVPEEDR